MGPTSPARAVRIINISGSPSDKRDTVAKVAAMEESVDVLVGDWMSELNMPTRAFNLSQGIGVGYEETFLEALEPALENIAKKRLKLIGNAGTVATKDLYDIVVQMVNDKGLDLTVAWVEGDVVLEQFEDELVNNASAYKHITTGQSLADWPFKPIFGQCYLGGMAIASALGAGADIVICGRVADASPIVGAAAWWHGWSRTDYDQLAQSLIAGHLIECSAYVTGGNFTGFKHMDWSGASDFGYPIAEIAHDGDVIITKPHGTGGWVTIETCKEQLLYEIQGMYYVNSDVTAVIDRTRFTLLDQNRVRLAGVTGRPPPRTTKMGLTAFGGYRAEIHWAVVGLDIEEKRKLLDVQLRASYGAERMSKFSLFQLTTYGSVPANPRCQNMATIDARLCVQAPREEDLSARNFIRPAVDTIMHSIPAATYHRDMRPAIPRPYTEYFPTLIPQPRTKVYFSKSTIAPIEVPPPKDTIEHPHIQPSYEPTDPVDLATFGPTRLTPLGYVVHARAGDKGSNCNVGLFVRHESEWPWLRSLLSTEKVIELMDQEYHGQKIDRMEFPHLWAVHFLVHDHLDRGVTANATYDVLGKFLSEYLRCKQVEVPVAFLERGII